MMWDTGQPVEETSYYLGLDLAQGGLDWTALCVLRRTVLMFEALPDYSLIWLERWRDRRTARVPETVTRVWRQIQRMESDARFQRSGNASGADPDIRLAVDITGVGGFGSDPLRKAGFDPTEIQIHGGDAVNHPSSHLYRVPKRDLAGVVHTLLESDRLRIASSLPDATVLRAELENFKAKISLTGHDTYGAGSAEEWREGAHDDLVLAVAVAAWLGEAHPTPVLDPLIVAAWTDLPRVR